MRRAQCACGQLAADCRGEPARVSVCHCRNCKRRTGSALAWTARWARADVAVHGRANQFTLTGDEGGRATFHFCPDCGVAVFYLMDGQPELIAIPAGAFADPAFPAPEYSSYDPSRRCPWLEIAVDGIARYD